MEDYRIGPIREADLESVAAFLDVAVSWREDGEGQAHPADGSSTASWLAELRWRLLENPARGDEDDFGQALRTANGSLAGVNLAFPARFVQGERRLQALCAGSFYVDPRARMQGFFMFRKFLKMPGADFFFATTCNAASGPLWEKLGGQPLPIGRETTTLLLGGGPIAEEYALRARLPGPVARLAGVAGRVVTPVLGLLRRRPGLTLAPCKDWDRLAALADRHRDPDVVRVDQSLEFLRWRFEASPDSGSHEVVVFHDGQGREGWFVARPVPSSGSRGQIRNWGILDACWPGDDFDPDDLVLSLARHYSGRADQLALPYDLARRSRLDRPLLWRRSQPVPAAYVIGPAIQGRPLSERVVLAPADGDRYS